MEEKYAKAASSSKKSTSPAHVQGGVFGVAKSGSSSGGGSTSTAGSSSTTAGAAATPTPTPGNAARSAIMGVMALAGVGVPMALVSFGAL